MGKSPGIFFPYYGAKFQWASRYPSPCYRTIIEPFAGAAGYSLRHHDADVLLNDADPVIAGVWEYLITSSEQEIRQLPLLAPGDDVRELQICQEARWLIGFWVNPGSATPKNIMSKFAKYPEGDPRFRRTRVWGEAIRDRIASQKHLITHWKIRNDDYRQLSHHSEATWFIDPPYQQAGRYYRLSSVDYQDLASWTSSREGQVIACEASGATWLPFEKLFDTETSSGKPGRRRYSEVIWTNMRTPSLFDP